ncbi:hypothetical protein SAMN02745163_02558 [Clostridium cavendishii DSM 21758]|uniref:Uncharacterized protein n=1 Tax=Clostridium cavendishii DSM 21758 TaxID=1121302 RepID=A0A1M6M113_9CLOT|nr:hypothetical protein [Clostridium cavendishii]SHJ77118.1 hypothetical protein SAMN02745163_02558 [Clostridium cavendishii DSM 21758]
MSLNYSYVMMIDIKNKQKFIDFINSHGEFNEQDIVINCKIDSSVFNYLEEWYEDSYITYLNLESYGTRIIYFKGEEVNIEFKGDGHLKLKSGKLVEVMNEFADSLKYYWWYHDED